jgi:hypothetical protein
MTSSSAKRVFSFGETPKTQMFHQHFLFFGHRSLSYLIFLMNPKGQTNKANLPEFTLILKNPPELSVEKRSISRYLIKIELFPIFSLFCPFFGKRPNFALLTFTC